MNKGSSKKEIALKGKHVVIYGGLGNQLFGWALAAYLQTSGFETKVLQAREGAGNNTHGLSASQYSAFGFSGGVGKLAPHWHLVLTLARRSRCVARFFRVSFTDSPAVTVEALQRSNAKWLVGYHQNFNPSQLLSPRQLALGVNFLDSPSTAVLTRKGETARQSYVAVHVRGGDLRYLTTTAGLLSPGYFVRAVQRLFSRYDIVASTAISIVTDDVEAAAGVFDALKKKGYSVSISDTANTPLEAAFQELSQADYLVVANSSFSYWAAIAGKPKSVAFPNPWRSDGKVALPIPTLETWNAVESEWSQSKDCHAVAGQ